MYSLFYFLLALAILVVVHEFGHFWVARRCGVKVLTFSVGFGKKLWSRTGQDGTEYVVSVIPLGGFVKMLDEREGSVKESQQAMAFNRQSLRKRVAIVAAGPIANLLFAVLAYWFIFVVGVSGTRSIIADVSMDSPAAQAQIIAGDEIKAINGKITPTWQSVYKRLSVISVTGNEAELTIDSAGIETNRIMYIPKQDDNEQKKSLWQLLGITPVQIQYKPIIGAVVEDGAAAEAGLVQGDQLLSHAGEPIESWLDWVKLIQASPELTLDIEIKRQGQIMTLKLVPKKNDDGRGVIGAGVDASQSEIPAYLQAELRYGPVPAVVVAVKETWQFSVLTVKSLVGMVNGSVSTKNLGGPISIAQYAGSSAQHGLLSFVSFLAMISISLGILNLLPIPVLDGGHLMMYFIEWLTGNSLSEQTQQYAQKVGIMLLLMLMFLAFFNDLSRVFG